jgi:hypothetical protein
MTSRECNRPFVSDILIAMKKYFLGTMLMLAASAVAALGCGCGDSPTTTLADKLKWALEKADAVFIGKAARFDFIRGVPNEFMQSRLAEIPGLTWETKTVVFEVDRSWKGIDQSDVSIVTETTRNSDGTGSTTSCEYPFEEGKTYLVFARKDGEYLRNIACSFTRRDDQTEEILPLLGEAKKPKTKDAGWQPAVRRESWRHRTPAGIRRSQG